MYRIIFEVSKTLGTEGLACYCVADRLNPVIVLSEIDCIKFCDMLTVEEIGQMLGGN